LEENGREGVVDLRGRSREARARGLGFTRMLEVHGRKRCLEENGRELALDLRGSSGDQARRRLKSGRWVARVSLECSSFIERWVYCWSFNWESKVGRAWVERNWILLSCTVTG